VIDHHSKPHFQPGDIVVAFNPSIPSRQSILSSEADSDLTNSVQQFISKYVENGGRVLSLPVAPDFATDSKTFYDVEKPILNSDGAPAKVSWDGSASAGFYVSSVQQGAGVQIWGLPGSTGNRPYFVALKKIGKGEEINVANGIVATNRFIDRAQNAYVLVNAINALGRGRVIFAEAAFGNVDDPGLLETIGPWALAGWFQFIFLGVVVIYTLGKPFGLPDPERRQERGARDLMDAIADTLRRGRMTKLALQTVYADSNRFLRRLYRGRRDPDLRLESQFDNMTSLQRALNKIEAAAEIGAPEDMAAKLIQDAENLLREAGAKTGSPY
jgi:hypothetical protein